MKFKVGQKVVMIKEWGTLRPGDVAIVTHEEHSYSGTMFIDVRWTKWASEHEPADGGYYLHQFKPFEENEQLLFDFMYEGESLT